VAHLSVEQVIVDDAESGESEALGYSEAHLVSLFGGSRLCEQRSMIATVGFRWNCFSTLSAQATSRRCWCLPKLGWKAGSSRKRLVLKILTTKKGTTICDIAL
jgi:hypothetical protein